MTSKKRKLTLLSLRCVDLVNDFSWDRISIKAKIDGEKEEKILLSPPEPFYFEDEDAEDPPHRLNIEVEFDHTVTINLYDYELGVGESYVPLGSQIVLDVLADSYPPMTFLDEGAEYWIEYTVERIEQTTDRDAPTQPGDPEPTDLPVPPFMAPKKGEPRPQGDLAKDKGGKKWILSLDGGGTRGIFELFLIKTFEVYYNKPAKEIFDMFAGSSTGAIIAAGLASGKFSTDALIAKYDNPDFRNTVFKLNDPARENALWWLTVPGNGDVRTVRGVRDDLSTLSWLFTAAMILAAAFTAGLGYFCLTASAFTIGILAVPATIVFGAWIAVLLAFGAVYYLTPDFAKLIDSVVKGVAPFLFVPKYKDGPKYALLDDLFGDTKLFECEKDLLVTVKDAERNETLYLTAFLKNGVPELSATKTAFDTTEKKGTFKEITLSAALKATTAAPTYFSPALQMLDGGVGTFNNPSFAAAIEALYYSQFEGKESKAFPAPVNIGRYKEGEVVVWSLGCGTVTKQYNTKKLRPSEDNEGDVMKRPDALPFWATYITDDAFSSASDQQNLVNHLVLQSLAKKIEHKRFNLFINKTTLEDVLGLTDNIPERIDSIKLDAVKGSYIDMREMALTFAQKVWERMFVGTTVLKDELAAAELELLAATDPAPLKDKIAEIKAELASRERGWEPGRPSTDDDDFTPSVIVDALNHIKPQVP